MPLHSPLHQVPFFSAFIGYINQLMNLDLGVSSVSHQPILEQLLIIFPATIELSLLTFIVALLIGIPLGVVSGLKEDSVIDKCLRVFSLIGFSFPIVWLGLLLISFFSLYLDALPASGRIDWRYSLEMRTGFLFIDIWGLPEQQRALIISDSLKHLLLPLLALTLAPLAEITYLVRENTIHVNNQPYIRAAQTRPISSLKLVHRHILPNAIPSLIPRFGSLFSSMLTMAIITEYIFTWPGIGRWLINSIRQDDYASISAGVLAIGLFVIVINTLANLFAVFLSPNHTKEWQTLG